MSITDRPEICAALTVVYAPTSSNTDRRAANEFLDQYQRTAPLDQALAFAAFSGLASNLHLRHFGLHILESAIRSDRWTSLTDAERGALQAGVLSLMRSGTAPLLEEPAYIREKLVQCAADLARRQWPQSWPDLFPQLEELFALGPTQAELSLGVLRCMGQDVFDTYEGASSALASIDASRRRDLMQGMIATADRVMSSLGGMLSNHLSAYAGILAAGPLGTTPDLRATADTHYRMALALLGVLAAYAPWVPSPLLFRDLADSRPAGPDNKHPRPENIVGLICRALVLAADISTSTILASTQETSLSRAATDVLLLLSTRKLSPSVTPDQAALLHPGEDARHGFLRLLDELPLLRQCLAIYRAGGATDPDSPGYLFEKRIAMVLCNFGLNHLLVKSSVDLPPAPAPSSSALTSSRIDEFHLLALDLFAHPSRLVSSMLSQYWLAALRALAQALGGQGPVLSPSVVTVIGRITPLLPGLACGAADKVFKIGDPDANVPDATGALAAPNPFSGSCLFPVLVPGTGLAPTTLHRDWCLATAYSDADFDSTSEFQSFFSVYRQSVHDIIRTLSQVTPMSTIQVCGEILDRLARTNLADPTLGLYTPDPIMWEGYSSFLETCVLGLSPAIFQDGSSAVKDEPGQIIHLPMTPLSESHFVQPPVGVSLSADIRAGCRSLLTSQHQAALRLQTRCPHILTRLLGLHPPFHRLLALDAAMLPPVLNYFFEMVTFARGDETGAIATDDWRVSEDVLAVRRKACSSLLRLALDIPMSLVPLFGSLLDQVGRLVSQQLVNDAEQTLLTESIIVIGLHHPDRAQFGALIGSLLQDQLAIWTSPTTGAHLSSTESFFTFLGISFLNGLVATGTAQSAETDPSIQRSWQKLVAERRRVFLSLSLLTSILRRVNESSFVRNAPPGSAHPLASWIPAMIPPLFSLVRCLHAIRDPASWEAIAPAIRDPILQLSELEKSQLMGHSTVSEYKDDDYQGRRYLFENLVDSVRLLTSHKPLLCYNFLAQLVGTGSIFYDTPMLVQGMHEYIFRPDLLQHLDGRFLRHMILLFARGFLQQAPSSEQLRQVALPSLGPFVTFIGGRITSDWQRLSPALPSVTEGDDMSFLDDAGQGDFPEDVDLGNLSDTVIELKIVVNLSRAFVEWMASLIGPGAVSAPESAPAPHAPASPAEMARMLLSDPAASRAVVTCLIAGCAEWRDGRCSKGLIQAALSTLHNPFLVPNQTDAVALLTSVYAAGVAAGPDDGLLLDTCRQTVSAAAMAAGVSLSLPDLEEALRRAAASKPRQRTAVRQFFAPMVGREMSEMFRANAKITALPEKLFIRTARLAARELSDHLLEQADQQDAGQSMASLFG
ncbi:hypothetical protein H696_00752 [Fonticula alba]|uniref:Uncharacterized protein n=1 Tax=Fonticula alba TaxID=691883 RepID=A0A058ZFP3_FONAL|nr:hypothetical protein H696_00752 [Fonticula alba]KCV73210.1 hypothetical protein H696_00752 [Fonticula alba]|eukprot:XP_009492911.1 hypothetical protein H696_00752 [Fonticula alba]